MARRFVAAVVVGALALAPLTPALAAAGPGLEQRLDRLTGEGGVAGALARTSDGVTVVSGTAERGTGRAMVGPDARFRVASLSKPIIAATVLRLVERGQIKLGAPVERYLPKVVRGKGAGAAIDGRKITVRDLLRQTSGLPDFIEVADWSKPGQDYLKLALGLKPTAAGRFAYSNTNYLVLGMIINEVTGKDFRQVSRDLVLKPLRMRDTYWPRKGETGLRGEHAHTYGVSPADPKGGVVDLTRLPGYEFGASGGLVSTPDDLNRFWRGVPVKKMTANAVRVGEPGWPAKARYGLGVVRARLSCGEVWMHGGDVPGVSALSGRNRAGRAATVYVTGSVTTEKQRKQLLAAFDTAMCDAY